MITETKIIALPSVDSLPAPVRALVPPAIPPLPPEAQLSPVQQEAFGLLIVGISDTDVAKTLRINRTTIWRWRTYDPNFIAALNQWRAKVIERVRDGMLALAEEAEKVVVASVKDGNASSGDSSDGQNGDTSPRQNFTHRSISGLWGGREGRSRARGKVAQDIDRIKMWMTAEQGERIAQLFAIGIVIDNQRANRPSPSELLDIAGDLHDRTTIYVQPSEQGSAPSETVSSSVSASSDGSATKGATSTTIHIEAKICTHHSPCSDVFQRRGAW